MFKKVDKAKLGFTLIELLVVIAIIGILASIVLASLNSARTKARDARRVADIKQIQLALAMYFDSYSRYPLVTSGLESKFINPLPADPVSSNGAYKYVGLGDDTPALCNNGTASPAIDCLSYHIGADLEGDGTGANGDGGNSVLKSDRDEDTSGITSGSEIGFAGLSADCGGTAGADDGCYDLLP